MGNIDTLEIKRAMPSPPRLVLHSHRRDAEFVCPVDDNCWTKIHEMLNEPGASFWLRSVSHTLIPYFMFWRRSKNFTLIIRVKHGSSRREVSVPCSKTAGHELLALSRQEWSDTA